MPSTIFYNGKSIVLPRAPSRWQIDPRPKKTVSPTMTGYVETILNPQVTIHVTGEYPLSDSATLRAQLHQWWQWACQGGTWAITHDANKIVDTTLAAPAARGDMTLLLDNGFGVEVDGIYKLWHGPNFEMVRVTDVDGDLVTLAESLNADYGAVPDFCVFRDQNFYCGRVIDIDAPFPIIDVTTQEKQPDSQIPQVRYRLLLDFYETYTGLLQLPETNTGTVTIIVDGTGLISITYDQNFEQVTSIYGTVGEVPSYDWQNPRGARYPSDLRIFTQSLKPLLRSKDVFFGAPGETKTYDWPNPHAYLKRTNENRTWISALRLNLRSQDKFFQAPGQPPRYDWPNPRGATYPSDLRTWLHAMDLNLRGKDKFFSAPGQPPRYDWPNPRGSSSNVNTTFLSNKLAQ